MGPNQIYILQYWIQDNGNLVSKQRLVHFLRNIYSIDIQTYILTLNMNLGRDSISASSIPIIVDYVHDLYYCLKNNTDITLTGLGRVRRYKSSSLEYGDFNNLYENYVQSDTQNDSFESKLLNLCCCYRIKVIKERKSLKKKT